MLIYTRIELHVGKKKNTFQVHINVICIKCLTPRPFFGKKAFNLERKLMAMGDLILNFIKIMSAD